MADVMEVSAAAEDGFDEAWYLKAYPDVAAAVARGGWKVAYEHFDKVGRERGRFASEAHRIAAHTARLAGTPVPTARQVAAASTAPVSLAEPSKPEATSPVPPSPVKSAGVATATTFDPVFYAESYPLARAEIAAGLATSLEEHYQRIGKGRGYLANRNAPRLENPANWHSRFGGFWTDQANALDILRGKLELGMITGRQADILRRFVEDGYVVLENAVPAEALDRAEDALDRAYHGGFPQLQFNIDGIGRKVAWQPETLVKPAKALDLHWQSPAIRDLIFAPELMDFLHLVMERRVFATQSLGFWRGSAQGAHQDSAYVNYSLPMQFLASWIALQDVSENSGELFYYVGSQKMPEYLYLDKFKGIEEAARMTPKVELGGQIQDHVNKIPPLADSMSFPRKRFMAKRGDILIWSSDLAHGGSPISTAHSRKSVVTHYTVAEAVPAYFESRSGKIRATHMGEYYSSAHYDYEPLND